MTSGWRILWLLPLLCALFACKAPKAGIEQLPRPAPAYLHWLQKDSMLAKTPELISEVSQSGRVWMQASAPGRADVLLKAAPTWLLAPEDARPPYFRALLTVVEDAARMGFGGIYLGDTGEKPTLMFSGDMPERLNSAALQFDGQFGTDADYAKLAQAAEISGLEVGSTLLPGATGMGADFLLQSRSAPGYAGLYAMLPLESGFGVKQGGEEWDCVALSKSDLSELVEKGILPSRLVRDRFGWATPGGWALTGNVTDAKGVTQRWLYRFSENTRQPALAWQDPSGLAARLLGSAVIRQTGLLGQSLTGLKLEALMGLEPDNEEAGANFSLSPGLEALEELSRQIHRYGGWSMLADAVPVSVIKKTLAGPCDFCRDDITELLAVFGLLAADGRPVAALYRKWIADGLDVSRLARGFNGNELLPRVLLDGDDYQVVFERIGQDAKSLSTALEKVSRNKKSEDLRTFLFAWRLGLPGLAFMDANGDKSLGFDNRTVNTMLNRKKYQLAAGRVMSVIRGKGGGLAIFSALPGNGYWIMGCNFGINADEILIPMPVKVKKAIDAASNDNLSANIAGANYRLSLDGRKAQNVILE